MSLAARQYAVSNTPGSTTNKDSTCGIYLIAWKEGWASKLRTSETCLWPSVIHVGGDNPAGLIVTNAILGASYQLFRHTETNETVIRTVGYSLPAALHMHVQTAAPTTYFGSPRALRQMSKLVFNAPTLPNGDLELQEVSAIFAPGDPVPSNCSSIITPRCLRMLYNTLTYSPQATSTNKLGITGHSEQFSSQSDLTGFLIRFRSDAATANFSVVTVNGGINNQSHPGAEANLDIQYAESISHPTPNIFYSTAGAPPFIPDVQETTNLNEPYWLDFILIQRTIPQTISTSYGDDEQSVPRNYSGSVCNSLLSLVRWVLAFSSGAATAVARAVLTIKYR